jgi:hypothetical protein
MAITRISLIAMETRDASRVFVRVPNEPGRWLLTDKCVALVPCEVCGAIAGEPCINRHKRYTIGTHFARRYAMNRLNPSARSRLIVEDIKPHIYLTQKEPE